MMRLGSGTVVSVGGSSEQIPGCGAAVRGRWAEDLVAPEQPVKP
jgi:hypothetical protein